MPKFIGGAPPFIGTQDNLTIYFMNGEYIVRTKSSLTGKRVKRDPAFAKTMMYAGWLKQASKIASVVYRHIPAEERVYKQYRQLTGKAMSLLKEGFHVADVIIMLEAVYLPQSVENEACEGTSSHRVGKVDHSSVCTIHSSERPDCKQKCVGASDVSDDMSCDKNSDVGDDRCNKVNEVGIKVRRGPEISMVNKVDKVKKVNKANEMNKENKVNKMNVTNVLESRKEVDKIASSVNKVNKVNLTNVLENRNDVDKIASSVYGAQLLFWRPNAASGAGGNYWP